MSTLSQKTDRLTMAQAVVKYLQVQHSERDGKSRRLIPGIFGIFGHGNVAGLGQALQEVGDGIHVKDLTLPEKVRVLDDPDEMVVVTTFAKAEAVEEAPAAEEAELEATAEEGEPEMAVERGKKEAEGEAGQEEGEEEEKERDKKK